MRTAKSTCRICSGFCGLNVMVDDEERVAEVRGDRTHPLGRGYACSKGLRIPEGLNSPNRLLHPLKRQADGTFERIPLDQAIDEIADRLGSIIEESGGPAVATFGGTSLWFNTTLVPLLGAFLESIGSASKFSTATIDQSAHQVTEGRMGYWDAGKQRLEDSDVALLLGTNPVVSLGAYHVVSADPVKRLREARARGLKLIVVDPRQTETARFADCFLQIRPGQDAALLAGMIRMILSNGWEDAEFCAEFADGVDDLRSAVEAFTPAFVADRAGVDAILLETATTMFARDSQRGIAIIGTGGSMGPHSNLVDHLAEALNVLCGRYLRAGERVPNPGVVGPNRDFHAEVVPPFRPWEQEPKLPSGHGRIMGEFPSGKLVEQLLRKDHHRIRAMFVNGANPAVCLPDQPKAIEGLRALDLLVSIDPYMTETAKLCHYILPPKLAFERHDVVTPPWVENYLASVPFAQYLPPVVSPPAGSDVIDDWYLYWALARRLHLPLQFAGKPMPGLEEDGLPPSSVDLLAQLLENARVPFATLRTHPDGYLNTEVRHVLPARPGAKHRFALAPPDVFAEIAELATEQSWQPDADYPHTLISRRERSVMNSVDTQFMDPGERGFEAFAYLTPADSDALGISPGDSVRINSRTGSIVARVALDEALRRGAVSMSHCRALNQRVAYQANSALTTNGLTTTEGNLEAINAMPRLSGIPVRISRLS